MQLCTMNLLLLEWLLCRLELIVQSVVTAIATLARHDSDKVAIRVSLL